VAKFVSFIVLLLAIGISVAFSVHQNDPLAVETVAVSQGNISTAIELTGRVINDQTLTLTALLDGEIIDVKAREGAEVTAGTILATLDNRHAKAMRDKAAAELAYQKQSSKSARVNYNRIKKISLEGNTSRQKLDDSLMQLRSAEAKVKIGESELRISELKLENAQIMAPFDGTVIEQTVEKGQWVEAGTHLFTLVASDGDVIEVQVDSGDAGEIFLQQSVKLSSDALPDKTWQSQVNWIAPAVTRVNSQPGNTFAVRVDVGKDSPPLMLGEQLDVQLITRQKNKVLLLPIQALVEESPGNYVVHVVDRDVAREIAVEVGIQSVNHAEIKSGISEGDWVIIPSAKAITAGMPVTTR